MGWIAKFGFGIVLGLLAAGSAAAADGTLRMGMTALPPAQGNPYTGSGVTARFVLPTIYEALVALDNEGNLQPSLAVSWTMRDPRTWEFKLRRGVTFSNGEVWNAFTAKAVLDFLRSDPSAATQTSNREPRRLSDVIAENAETLVIKTPEPNAVLPRHLTLVYFTAPQHLARVGFEGLITQPIGTGPYVPESWGPAKIVMHVNPTAWRKPKIAKIEFLALPEPATRVQALEAGQIDVAMALNPEQVDSLAASGIHVHKRKPVRILSIAFESLDPSSPFTDVRLRQAVAYAVNVKALTQSFMVGMVEPASQGATATSLGFDPTLTPLPYDPAKSRALLKDAGKPNGFSFVMEFPAGTLSYDAPVMQQIAADLALVGIKMEIRAIPYAQYTRQVGQGGWKGSALMLDYDGLGGDALRAFDSASHSCAWSRPWFCDRVVEAKIEAAAREPNLDKRTAMTREILGYYRETAESLLLFPILGIDGLGPKVTHWETWNDAIQYDLLEISGR